MPAELKTETGGKHFLPGRGLGMNHSMLFDFFFFNRCVYNFGLLKKTDFLRERGQSGFPSIALCLPLPQLCPGRLPPRQAHPSLCGKDAETQEEPCCQASALTVTHVLCAPPSALLATAFQHLKTPPRDDAPLP